VSLGIILVHHFQLSILRSSFSFASVLTLANVFSQTGFIGGILLELIFATLALYTNYLLVSMHAQHRHNLKENGDAKHHDPYHIVSYHEVSSHHYFGLLSIFH
jgi:hypothetical protein